MKIVCISDTHNLHHKIPMPDGDMLIHAGDATMRGKPHEIENFLRWMEGLPYKYKIFVPGNHDFFFDKTLDIVDPSLPKAYLKTYAPSVIFLKNKETTIEGLKIYGTPWVKGLPEWAFGWKSDDGRAAEFAAIPPDTDILITHGPAYGYLDLLYSMRLGDEQLTERIEQLEELKLHVHGHIHWSYGATVGTPTRVNAAICDEAYKVTNAPIIVEV